MTDAQGLGSELRAAREARDLTLEQAEQQTRIRAKYLDALEEGNYAILPSAVQARGFLRNYARFLNLDADIVIARYDAMQGGRRRRRVVPATVDDPTMAGPSRRTKEMHPIMVKAPAGPPAAVEPTYQEPRRGFQLGGILIGGVVLLILAGLLVIGAQTLQSYLSRNDPNRLILSPFPQTDNSAAATATTAATAQPVRPTPLPSPVPNVDATQSSAKGSGSGIVLTLNITERTWIRVTVDGAVTYVGSAAPNTTLKYEGSSINVRVANAIGVHVNLNGQDQGVLGARGQIVDQTYTVNGAANSTAPPNADGAGQTTGQTLLTSPGATFSLDPRISPTASVLPTRAPSKTFTYTPTNTSTPSSTWTPSITFTPSITRTPTMTFTASVTQTGTPTVFLLPRETSTPLGADIRPK